MVKLGYEFKLTGPDLVFEAERQYLLLCARWVHQNKDWMTKLKHGDERYVNNADFVC